MELEIFKSCKILLQQKRMHQDSFDYKSEEKRMKTKYLIEDIKIQVKVKRMSIGRTEGS